MLYEFLYCYKQGIDYRATMLHHLERKKEEYARTAGMSLEQYNDSKFHFMFTRA